MRPKERRGIKKFFAGRLWAPISGARITPVQHIIRLEALQHRSRKRVV